MKLITNDFNAFIALMEALGYTVTYNGPKSTEKVKEEEEKETIELDFFIHLISRKKGWRFEKTYGWLQSIAEVSPVAVFNILLREIAVYLDHQYADHIENSEKIFIISTLDGRIHEVCKAHVKNYRNFAAFRTMEDAKFACRVMRDQLKSMFTRHAKGK